MIFFHRFFKLPCDADINRLNWVFTDKSQKKIKDKLNIELLKTILIIVEKCKFSQLYNPHKIPHKILCSRGLQSNSANLSASTKKLR